jgi:membrane associated rhomboid family serine protease
MSHPDLFVVCKNCQAEVSPYITECPYCGMRLRKRAPKIERPDAAPPKPSRRPQRPSSRGRAKPKVKAASQPRLGRLRGGEIPGIRGDETAKPWATAVLVALSFGIWLTVVFYAAPNLAVKALDGHPWLYLSASLMNANTAAQFAVVAGLGLFGWLIERRHGAVAVVAIFLLCGPGALAIAVALDPGTFVFGTQGAALGLLCAWLVPVLIRRSRDGSDDDDADLLGVLVIAVVLLLVPVLSQSSLVTGDVRTGLAFSGLIGAGLGAIAGLILGGLRSDKR